MAGLPIDAMPADTGEFMLGTVAVTPILLESNGQVDTSSENWLPAEIDHVLADLNTGLNWWKGLLATKSTVHTLDFTVDTTYARTPAPTVYEPITRVSNDYANWVKEFLVRVGFDQSNSLETNIRAFNNSQRLKLGTDWAFSVFIVDSQNDADGSFAAGGSFRQAFGFAGGLFFVIPSTRPASTYAHETGHMFWARDEYAGGGSYNSFRGYYNTQNLNAVDGNPVENFQQAPSIMTSGTLLQTAYSQFISPPSTLAMVGWQDSNGDGIFDVLDVPLSLDGVGRFDSATSSYKFVGKAKAQTLPNLNSSGLGNDITLNRISRIEYRFNTEQWSSIAQPDTQIADLNLSIPVPAGRTGTIDIRAVDAKTGILSNIYNGTLDSTPSSTLAQGIQGFAWFDGNRNSVIDTGDEALKGWTARLVDAQGNLLPSQIPVEPDNKPSGPLLNGSYSGVSLSAVGQDTDGRVAVGTDSLASTGTKVFQGYALSTSGFSSTWNGDKRKLRVDISAGTNFVSVDVIGAGSSSYGRLEIYDSSDKLLDRVTSGELTDGQATTLSLGRSSGDIAYAIVKGHMSTAIRIDNVRVGYQNTTTTDGAGRYVFPYLPAGVYTVQLVAPTSSFAFTNTPQGKATVDLGEGEALGQVNIGAEFTGSHWHNWRSADDVNNDGGISPLDVLLIVNHLNNFGAGPLVAQDLPYIDTTNDGGASPLDVLAVVNFLNAQADAGNAAEGESTTEQLATSPATASSVTVLSTAPAGEGAVDFAFRTPTPRQINLEEQARRTWCLNEDVPAVANETSSRLSSATEPILQVAARRNLILDDALVLSKIKATDWTLPIPCTCAACLALEALQS